MIKTVNVLDRNDEINKVIQVFERNKEFDFFYDKEKEECFLRKNKKIYTGEYEEVKNYIDMDFKYENLNGFLHKERAFYKDGKKDGISIYEFFKSNIRFEINYKNGKRDGKYSIYRFSKKQNKIVRIYEEGIYADDKKISFTKYHYNRKDELEINNIDYQKLEEILIFRDGTKIVKKVFKKLGKRDLFNFPISSSNSGLLEANQYKDDKIKAEAFFSAGILKKIIYYNENEKVSSIDYFDIYYAKEETSLSYIYSDFNFYNLDKYFETKFLKESDIKIYTNREYGFNFLGNYPSDMIKAEEEALMLRTLKENIKIERKDIKKYIDYFESFPTMTEYYSNGKIIKKDIYKVERIMEISHPCDLDANLSLNGVLEKTEKYNDNNEIVEIKKLNRHIYVVNVGFGDYLPRIEFDD